MHCCSSHSLCVSSWQYSTQALRTMCAASSRMMRKKRSRWTATARCSSCRRAVCLRQCASRLLDTRAGVCKGNAGCMKAYSTRRWSYEEFCARYRVLKPSKGPIGDQKKFANEICESIIQVPYYMREGAKRVTSNCRIRRSMRSATRVSSSAQVRWRCWSV